MGFAPTQRGWWVLLAAVVLTGLAVWWRLPALLAVAGMLLGLLVMAGGIALIPARLAVTRTLGHGGRGLRPTAGEEVTFAVELRHLGRLTRAGGVWRDRVPAEFESDGWRPLPLLRAGGSVRLEHRVRPSRRGRHAVGPLEIDITDPFGLFANRQVLGESDDLVVLPRRVALGDAEAGDTSGEAYAVVGHSHVGAAMADDILVRPYQPGDAIKRVHWKATAHQGSLVVRQEEARFSPSLAVVVDQRSVVHGESGPRPDASMDIAVSAAASVLEHVVQQGESAVLFTDGAVTEVDSAHRLAGALETLADVSSSDRLHVGEGMRSRHTIVLTGELSDDSAHDLVGGIVGPVTVFAHGLQGPRVRSVVEAAGWRLVEIRSGESFASAWARGFAGGGS